MAQAELVDQLVEGKPVMGLLARWVLLPLESVLGLGA
jgi:hypothetical protein